MVVCLFTLNIPKYCILSKGYAQEAVCIGTTGLNVWALIREIMVDVIIFGAVFYNTSFFILAPSYPTLTHFRFVGDVTVKTLIRRNKSFQNLFGLDDRLANRAQLFKANYVVS